MMRIHGNSSLMYSTNHPIGIILGECIRVSYIEHDGMVRPDLEIEEMRRVQGGIRRRRYGRNSY